MPEVVTNEQLAKKLDDHMQSTKDRFQKGDKSLEKLNRVIFGDKETGEKGMNEKVTDIHTRTTQVDGVGSLLKWLIILGGAFGVIKLWLIGGGKF